MSLSTEKDRLVHEPAAARGVAANALVALAGAALAIIVLLPVMYSEFEAKGKCDSSIDKTSHMMAVSNVMLRSWGEGDYNSYFQWADPGSKAVHAFLLTNQQY